MTNPEPDEAPTEYPSAWKPDYVREAEAKLEPLEIELALAAMPKRELALLLQRIGAMR